MVPRNSLALIYLRNQKEYHAAKGQRCARNPKDTLAALACGYLPADRQRKVYVMIQGFGDESEGRIFSLTACILEYDAWQRLTEEWANVLAESPAIDHFHMKEARELSGQFYGLNAIQRDMKIIRLVSCIINHRPRIVTSWAVTDEYKEIVGDQFAHETKLPYFPCFLHLLWFIAYQSKTSESQLSVDFTFDEKGDVGIQALKWFQYCKRTAPPELLPYFGATPVFRDDTKLIPLQVADLVAWHVHRKLETPGMDIERAATQRLDDLQSMERRLTEQFLMELAVQFSEVFQGPLAFIMRERPSRRKRIFDKLKKQFKNRAKKMAKESSEFEKFDTTMRKLISVPHSKIKAKLEAEKKAKTGRREASAKEKGNNR